jgi:membrane protease subunit (stomatin/prohibitin family)
MNSQLTVRESQWAVFMNEGAIADVFSPGMYTLSTQNMPVMTTLRGWKYGFNSPFKADVFFVSQRQFTNQKWGTRNPIMLRDAEFGPIRLRAFGSFAFRVKDAAIFLKEVAATNPEFSVEGINEQLRNLAVSRGMDAIAEAKIPVLDLAANYDEVSARITDKIKPEFTELGLELTKFLIENISLPPEVEAALDKRSSMGIVGNLGAYAQYQAANAMEQAAANPAGGLAGAGLGAGLGMAVGGQMGNVFANNTVQGNDGPPPLPGATPFYAAIDGKQAGPYTLEQLSQLVAAGTINAQSQVWKKGMAAWAAANTVPELAAVFSNMPPPLPNA